MRAVIFAIVLGAAASVAAQPSPDYERAKQLYTQANTEMANGHYSDAARDYGGAYDITKDPILFFKIATANEKAGHCDVAVVYYSRFLKEGSPKPEHAQLAKQRIVACGGKIPDASAQATTPVTPPPATPPAAPPATTTTTPATAATTAAAPEPEPPSVRTRYVAPSHTTAWLLTGASLALITTGAVLAYSASSSEQDLKDLYAGVNNAPPQYDAKTASRYHDLVDQGQRYEHLSWAAFAAAGACAITGAVFFMRSGHEERVSVAPIVTPHESGVAAQLRF
jgi:hypothetical protein